jgi:hypothetical protein
MIRPVHPVSGTVLIASAAKLAAPPAEFAFPLRTRVKAAAGPAHSVLACAVLGGSWGENRGGNDGVDEHAAGRGRHRGR